MSEPFQSINSSGGEDNPSHQTSLVLGSTATLVNNVSSAIVSTPLGLVCGEVPGRERGEGLKREARKSHDNYLERHQKSHFLG